MNGRDDIIRMARGAELWEIVEGYSSEYANGDPELFLEELERFAALVAAAERERCAQICDSVGANAVLGTANECARAIRGEQ